MPHGIWKKMKELEDTKSQCLPQGHTSGILVFFLVAVRKHLDKRNVRENWFVWLTVVGNSPLWKKSQTSRRELITSHARSESREG